MLLTYEEALSILDDIADSFPEEFYQALNGAILLLPEANHHPDEPDLFTLGAYCHDLLGRRIELYYGSFAELAECEDWSERDWQEELRATLSHEFTHHWESLAGERGLEVKDELFMEQYRESKRPKKYRVVKKTPPSTDA